MTGVNEQAAMIASLAKRIASLERAVANGVPFSDINALDGRLDTLETATTPTAWTDATLTNSWTGALKYRKVGDMVHVRANVDGGTYTGSPQYSDICTLPVGFRPGVTFVLAAIGEVPNGWTAVEIRADGIVRVTAYYSGTSQQYVYLPYVQFSVTP